MTKSIKIVTGIDGWDTKIYIDNEDITKNISGIFGIDAKFRIDNFPKITIHRNDTKCEYKNEICDFELNIVNHKFKI